MASKKDDIEKKDLNKEQVLLTEAEFERRQRLKSKERLNRITRVFGVLAILLLSCSGIFEPFFEMTYFGAIFTPDDHTMIWEYMEDLRIFDDWLKFYDPWLAKIGITALTIVAAVFIVYFLTYTIVDLIGLFKTLFEAGRDITKDLGGNIKDTISIDMDVKQKPKKKATKKSLFSGDDVKADEVLEKPQKQRRQRRTEADATGLENLSTEQIDALLSGVPMEEVLSAAETPSLDIELEPLDLNSKL